MSDDCPPPINSDGTIDIGRATHLHHPVFGSLTQVCCGTHTIQLQAGGPTGGATELILEYDTSDLVDQWGTTLFDDPNHHDRVRDTPAPTTDHLSNTDQRAIDAGHDLEQKHFGDLHRDRSGPK